MPRSIVMRYYRLWIYACNVVLLGSTIGFIVAASRMFLFSTDPRRYLIPGVPRVYDPTTIYAYFAVIVQLGLVQLLGCIAVRRLSVKLLNAYWLLLFALFFGDMIIGIAWIYRFERIRADLRPNLKLRLQVEYNKQTGFSEHWDQMQRDFSCCGITGPSDFGNQWPRSCCSYNDAITKAGTHAVSNSNPYMLGCEDQLKFWLKRTADVLFVLGFCVISFTKLCFLGILRCEIREMIEKIRFLRELPSTSGPFMQSTGSVQSTSTLQQQQQEHQEQQQLTDMSFNNGSISRRTTVPIVTTFTTSGVKSLII